MSAQMQGQVKIRDTRDPFARVPNSTAQDRNLTAAALGVLTFLISLPKDWEIRDYHIMNHFNRGRDWLRSVYKCLVAGGYAERLHKVRSPNGTFRTITNISPYPDYAGCGLTGGGLTATGSITDGQPTTLQREINKEVSKKNITTNPAASGGGKRGASASRRRVTKKNKKAKNQHEATATFEYIEGLTSVRISQDLRKLLADPDRLLGILLSNRLSPDQVRMIFAEIEATESLTDAWALCAKLAYKANPATATPALSLSARGEAKLPAWN